MVSNTTLPLSEIQSHEQKRLVKEHLNEMDKLPPQFFPKSLDKPSYYLGDKNQTKIKNSTGVINISSTKLDPPGDFQIFKAQHNILSITGSCQYTPHSTTPPPACVFRAFSSE